ncbi:MAG: TIM barrel protein [Planctomycetota bacterium]
MRLGGPILEKHTSPEAWIHQHRNAGYRAAYCPVNAEADDATVRAYADAAADADLLIAEVGAWSNPIDPSAERAAGKLDYCIGQLALAERIGARCCVNIAGSRHPDNWAGPHPDNFSDATFALIVETTRKIIDAVRPTRTVFALEMMQWVFPSTADEYLRLIDAIDRPTFAVHLDPVNVIVSPAHAFDTGRVIHECFEKLGPHIVSAHAKDLVLGEGFTVHLDEALPGRGTLDYAAYLRGLARLDPDTPLMLEHLETAEEYREAAEYIRGVAWAEGLDL